MRKLEMSKSIADRKQDSLEKYLNEISRIDLLSVEEEVRLAVKIREGDRRALDLLVNANLRFVVSVAKKYQDKGLRLADLISEGNLGLIKAAMRYDHTKGFKFISFAVWWIRQSITYAISDQKRMIRLPGNQISGLNKLNKVSDVLEQELHRKPTYVELAEAMKFSPEKVADYHRAASGTVSLEMPTLPGEEGALADVIPDSEVAAPDDVLERESLVKNLKRLLTILPEREQQIIILYYGIDGVPPTRLEDMVEVFQLSKERLRQLKDKAIKVLKARCGEASMRGFFG